MDLAGKRVLVVGFGKTGYSVVRFALARGARVTLTDIRTDIEPPRDFPSRGVAVETGPHRVATFLAQDLIVVSPGVPLLIRPVIEARSRGIEVISEIELAGRFLSCPLIAVTGTNGKTTTTSLIGSMFTRAGKNVFVGGNIGTPLIEAVDAGQCFDYAVAEVSSFQLEAVTHFRPAVSVLLNITDDHLDRHPTFGDYARAKSNIFRNQRPQDTAILNYDDPQVRALAGSVAADIFFCSTAAALENGAFYDDRIRIRRPGRPEVAFSVAEARLQGAHNRENMLAAAAAGFVCGLQPEVMRAALVAFPGLPHRMEFVGEVAGVSFYDDSKGTNVGACVKALESLDAPILLIAGGKDKGGSYEPLRDSVARKVKGLILIGEARDRIADELGALVPTVKVATLEDAVREACARACAGDRVLLSPACASFDMFQSYEHRGRCFRDAVGKLIRSASACTRKA